MGSRVGVDFDGVIHRYSKGWCDGSAYDVPEPNSREALKALKDAGYDVFIFSSRDPKQIRAWLFHWEFEGAGDYLITNEKLPALAIIDDRAIRFENWEDAFTQLLRLYPLRKKG